MDALADELRSRVEVVVIPADLSDPDAMTAMWRHAIQGRDLEIVINNAGLGSHDPLATGDWERELRSIKVNTVALTYLTKSAIAHMNGRRGRILNVASIAAFMPGPGMAIYHATKSYALSLSEALADELRGTKITVTALCPGPTDTNFFDDAQMHDVRLLKQGSKMSVKQVVDAGWFGMISGKRVVIPGVLNNLLAFIPRLFPKGILTRIAAVMVAKDPR